MERVNSAFSDTDPEAVIAHDPATSTDVTQNGVVNGVNKLTGRNYTAGVNGVSYGHQNSNSDYRRRPSIIHGSIVSFHDVSYSTEIVSGFRALGRSCCCCGSWFRCKKKVEKQLLFGVRFEID